jgi:hypothetical protein
VKLILLTALLLATLGFAAGAEGNLTEELRFARAVFHREAMVVWGGGTRPVGWFARAGVHQVEVECSHVPDKTMGLRIEIRQILPDAEGRPAAYLPCAAGQLRDLEDREEPVRVTCRDTVRSLIPEAELMSVFLPDGSDVRARSVFDTAHGVICLLPEGERPPAYLRAGRSVELRGWLIPGDATPQILAERVLVGQDASPRDEPPWDVRVYRGSEQVLRASRLGWRSIEIPCPYRPDRTEFLGVRVRQFPAVGLEVGGRPVTAEPAVTSAERSYGLQGRSGLAQDHGMLFVFRRALRPRFVMKSVSFPLSIAFIRGDGVIADIRDMQPGDQWGVEPDVPVNYVLEMEQGWFRRNGVGEGDRVSAGGGQDER